MKTTRQIAEKSGQTVHVYYNEQTKQYEAFRLYSERKDDPKNDEPTEGWKIGTSAAYLDEEQGSLETYFSWLRDSKMSWGGTSAE